MKKEGRQADEIYGMLLFTYYQDRAGFGGMTISLRAAMPKTIPPVLRTLKDWRGAAAWLSLII